MRRYTNPRLPLPLSYQQRLLDVVRLALLLICNTDMYSIRSFIN